jgi:hypothetical protein
MSYDEFVQRVRSFNRTSLLLNCTRVGWRVWNDGERSGLRFDDGLEGHVYLGDLVEETAMEVLSDAALFRRVAFDPVSNVLTWSGGIRIDPDMLYRNLATKAGAALH